MSSFIARSGERRNVGWEKPAGWRPHAIIRKKFIIILKWFLRKNFVTFLYNKTKQMHQFLKFTPT